jgi:hypothetical protein
LPVKFEYTAARTPQQNSQVEVGFAVIANRGRSLMAAAHVPEPIRRLIWNEAFQAATLLDGLMVVEVNGVQKTRWEHWLGDLPKFTKFLRTWGEAGVVKTRSLTTPKVADRGVPCMFVGYSKNHPGDTYRMYDPATGGIHDVRDVIWLHRMYYQVPLSPKEFQVQSDGVLRDDPVYLQVHDFVDVDVMEAFDAAPATQATVTAPVELEEDGNGDNDNNNDDDHDNSQQEQTTMRSGRVVVPRVRFDDIDWQEYDAAACQNLSNKQLVQQVI